MDIRMSKWTKAAALALLVGAGCNASDPEPFDARVWQRAQKEQSKSQNAQEMPSLPTTGISPLATTQETDQPPATTGPALGVEPVARLTLQDLIQRATANSLDVKIAGYGPAISGARTSEAEAAFDPTFFSQASYEKRNRQTALNTFFDQGRNQNILVDYDQSDVLTFQTGLRQRLESGGQAELRYQWTNTDNDPLRSIEHPFYENELVLQITQPLLRDFGADRNLAEITIARNNQRISLLDFRKQLEDTLARVEQTYWQLVSAERNVVIQENLLDGTMGTADILKKRIGQDVTRVQLSQANASVESRRASLIRARARVRDLSDQIKQLVNDPDMPVSSQTLILSASLPIDDPIQFRFEEQVDSALNNRLELAQQIARIDSAEVTRRAAKNNILPKFDIIGQGIAQSGADDVGTLGDRSFSNPHFGWTIGLQLEIPIGNRAARAIYRRTLLTRQQEVDRYRSFVEQVTLDVKTALREIHTTWDEMVARRLEVFAQQDALRAIQQREDNQEPLTPTFVQLKLDTQDRVASAQSNEAEAVSNYNIAIARLEQAKGTLLRYNNVVMAEEQLQK